jgi:hypothetical protein
MKLTGSRVTKLEFWCLISGLLIFLYSIRTTGPINEGYSLFENRKYWSEYFGSMAGRPLTFLPNLIALNIGTTNPFGFIVVMNALSIFRILIFYKLYRLRATAIPHFILFCFAFLLPWANVMNERYFPASTAATLILLAFLFSEQNRIFRANVTTLTAGLFYPPVSFIFPVYYIIEHILKRKSVKEIIFAGGTLGSLVFLLYYAMASTLFPTSYDAATTGNVSVETLIGVYRTTYISYWPHTVLLVSMILLFANQVSKDFSNKLKSGLVVLVFLPLSSLVYATSNLHVNDPERIFFPLTVTILLLIASNNPAVKAKNFSVSWQKSLVFTSLVTSLILLSIQYRTFESYQDKNRQLIEYIQGNQTLNSRGETRLLVIDYTGIYGDVYSFHEPAKVLRSALSDRLTLQEVTICNDGKTYSETVSSRFPISAARVCADLKQSEFDVVITISNVEPFIATTRELN